MHKDDHPQYGNGLSSEARSPSIPRLRRILSAELERARTAMATLVHVRDGLPINAPLDPVAIDALVCAAMDMSYPPDEHLAELKILRDKARAGQLRKKIPLALDEIESVVAILEAAKASLGLIDTIGERIPAGWDNYPPVYLGRKLNRLGHTILRGRVPGTRF